MPITNSIHHSAPITDPSAPIDTQILEDHFIDLPDDLFVFIPTDITNNPDLHTEPLPHSPVLDFASLPEVVSFLFTFLQ